MGYPEKAGLAANPSLWGDDPSFYDMASKYVGECTWYANGRSAAILGGREKCAPWGPKGGWPGASAWITDYNSECWVPITSSSSSYSVAVGDIVVMTHHVAVVESIDGTTYTFSGFNQGDNTAGYHLSLAPVTTTLWANCYGQIILGYLHYIGPGSGEPEPPEPVEPVPVRYVPSYGLQEEIIVNKILIDVELFDLDDKSDGRPNMKLSVGDDVVFISSNEPYEYIPTKQIKTDSIILELDGDCSGTRLAVNNIEIDYYTENENSNLKLTRYYNGKNWTEWEESS